MDGRGFVVEMGRPGPFQPHSCKHLESMAGSGRGYIGPIGKVHFAPLGNRDGGCKAPIGKLHFVPQGCTGVGRMVAGRAGTVLASAICWAATLAAGTGVQRGEGGTVAGGEGVSGEGETGTVAPAGCPTLATPAAKTAGKTWASCTSWPWCASVVQDAAAEARQPDRHRKGRQGSAAPGQAVSAVRWIPD